MKSGRTQSLGLWGMFALLACVNAAVGCGDDTDGGSGGSGGAGASGSSSSSGGGSSTSSASSGVGGGSASSSASGAGGAGGGEATSSSSTGGSATCPGPLEFDDGDPCSFPDASCPSACGIEEMGSRNCACSSGTADCDACAPPDAAKFPINPKAVDCKTLGGDGTTASIRNMTCTEAQKGTSCIGTEPNGRGCVCWDLGPGLQWECGSINKWFAK
jgi:hypothetical protein